MEIAKKDIRLNNGIGILGQSSVSSIIQSVLKSVILNRKDVMIHLKPVMLDQSTLLKRCFKFNLILAFLIIWDASTFYIRHKLCMLYFRALITNAMSYQFGLATISGFRDHSNVTQLRTSNIPKSTCKYLFD